MSRSGDGRIPSRGPGPARRVGVLRNREDRMDGAIFIISRIGKSANGAMVFAFRLPLLAPYRREASEPHGLL